MSIAFAEGVDDLLERLSQDIDGAFPDVVGAYQDAVFTIACRLSGPSGDAENLAAETFLRAYQALRQYPGERIRQLQLRPWLVTIVLNLWRNQVRKAARQPSCVPLEAMGEPRSELENPEERAERHDDGRALAVLLARLSPSQQEAVVLKHVAGLSYAEIADILGRPEGTAKSHVARGLQRLRLLIADTSFQEDRR